MSEALQEESSVEEPKPQTNFLPFVSLLVGCSALWFAWFRYCTLVDQGDASWYPWVQIVAIALTGVLCLLATVILFFDRSSGKAMLKTGLSIIPLLLFTNLVILLVRVAQSAMQGNAIAFLTQLYASPLNKAILIVAVVLIVLSILEKMEKE